MKYWIDKNADDDNVIVLSKDSLVIASCATESIAGCEQKLSKGSSFSDVFGSDNFELITLQQIFKLVARSTETDVDVEYKVKKEEESKLISFENIDASREFLTAVESVLPEYLKKKEYQQSWLSAGLPSLLSFITALGVSAMYFNKFRWLTLIIGGIWALVSLYTFFTRVTNPPLITQWSSKNVLGSAWSQLKTAGGLVLLALVVFTLSAGIPDNYGETAFVQHMDHDELTASNVATLLENGGDINRLSDDYGIGPLHHAVQSEDLDLFTSLLENGADPALKDEQGSDALDESVYYEQYEMAEVLLTDYSDRLNLEGKLNDYIGSSIKLEMLTLLFSNGVDPREVDRDGNNALQAALMNSADYELVSKLIEYKVPSNVKLDGRSLKQYALDNGQGDIAGLFGERDLSFERERQLTAEIDTFYAKKIEERLSKAPPILKLIARSEGVTDEDTQELAQDFSKSMQYKSLLAIGNQRILSEYAISCEKSGFEHAVDFSRRVAARDQKLDGHSRVSELIIERNRPVYNEAKDEFVTPTDFQERVSKTISKIEKLFLDADKEGASTEALNKKCSGVYDNVRVKK